MKPGFGTFLIYLMLIELAIPAMRVNAQMSGIGNGNGIVNSAGEWARQVGTIGANANRRTADQLFQQAEQHKAQGLSSFPPNVGLLSQALTESQQGIKADDQARHFAQTSLQAVQTGNTAGNVDLSGRYGSTSESLHDLANNTSSFYPQVQNDLTSFGIQINHDRSVIQTKFGNFPVSAGPEEMASAMEKIANSFGLSSNSVREGVQKGIENANAIAQRALAEAQAAAGANPSRAVAAANSAAADVAKPAVAAVGGEAKVPARATTAAVATTSAEQDLQARTLALNKSREAMLKQMGAAQDSLGDKSQNLFAIVHERYQELRRIGTFNEFGERVAGIQRHIHP